MDNLVQIYDNFIPVDYCNRIIAEFELDPNIMEGVSGVGVNHNIKKSTDLMITSRVDSPVWNEIYQYINEALLHACVDYVSKFPMISRTAKHETELSLIRTVNAKMANISNLKPHMQMQRYIGGEGFYAWHRENYTDNPTMSKREMFYIIYLNDVEESGETEFLFNPMKVKPKAGSIILAPAFWTHTHRGNPLSDPNARKYIITGWLEFTENVNVNYDFLEDYTI
jgi:hypothetical protein